MADDKKSDRDKLDDLILLFLGALFLPMRGYVKKPKGSLATLLLPVIADYHAQAAVMGRQAADVPGDLDKDDKAFGKLAAKSDAPYLRNLGKQVKAGFGKDDGDELDDDAIRSRMRLYAERLHATAHEAFVLGSPTDSAFIWHLGDVLTHHCGDCPVIAEGSPYTQETLPTYPGAGDTECLTLCKCWLERQDGVAPFRGAL